MDIEEIKIIVANWAKEEPLVTKAYIFGSRARDDYREDSDIDIAVEIKKLPGDGNVLATWIFESDKLKERLSKLLPYSLQLEHFDGSNTPHVLAGIEQSSILVYEEISN